MPNLTPSPEGPDGLRPRYRPGRAALLLLLLCGGILVGGGLLLQRQVRALRVHEEEELQVIAELKAGEIAVWHADRRRQAERILRNRILQAQLLRAAEGNVPDAVRRDLQAWMDDWRRDDCLRIALVDREGRIRLQSPEAGPAPALEASDPEFQAALGAGGVHVQPPRRDPADASERFSLWIPVRDTAGKPAAGLVMAEVDTSRFLGPLLGTWPGVSRTAETLLVARTGESARVLAGARFLPSGAPGLRLPLQGREQDPIARAALGREGLVSGPDYRGIPVLAAVRVIPGTGWALVAKIDEAEIYRDARREARTGLLILGGLASLVVLAAALLFRQRQLREARLLLDLERKARSATERYRELMDQASESILVLDPEGRILEANRHAVAQYGYGREELERMTVADLRAPETRDDVPQLIASARSGETLRFETLHQHRDGRRFHVEVCTRQVTSEGRDFILSFIRDISLRKAQDQENERMTRLYGALSQVNETIVRSRDRDSLLARTCEVLVQSGGFSMAWIGRIGPDDPAVEVVARCGDGAGYLEAIRVRGDESPLGQGPVGRAIRENCPCVVNDFLGDARSAPWHEAARRSGFLSMAAFPVLEEGHVRGALAVYAKEKDFFGAHEVALLTEAALDVSFALDHLAVEARRAEAEASLRESERFLREAEAAGGVGCYTWDIQGDRWVATEALDRIIGVPPDHPRNLASWIGLVEPDHRQGLEDYVRGLLANGGRFDFEYPIIRPSDGQRRWLHGTGELRGDSEGRPSALVGVIQDVTVRRQREQDQARMMRLYAALSQVNQAIVHSRDPQQLLDRICCAMVEAGQFSMAWIGWDDPGTHLVRVAAHCGDEQGYLETIRVRSDDSPEGRGPTGRAIREGVPTVVNDFLAFPDTQPWHAQARRCGYAASASFPIRQEGRTVGALMVYAPEKGYFGSLEISLLEEAATDVSFALDHLAGEARRTEAEQALRFQRDEFETIFNRVPAQIWYKDTRNRCLRVNDKVCQDLGMARDRIEGHSAEELFPEFAEAYYRDDREVLASGRPKLGILEQINTADGRRLWLRTDKVPVFDADGRPTGILAIVEDLTYWREAEESLHTVYTAMEQSPVAVLITDAAGAIQYVNPAFTRITGYGLEEVLGRNPRLLGSGHHPRAFFQEMWETLTEGRVWAGEILNRRKDGGDFTVMSTISPVRDSAGTVIRFVAIQEDITERKRAEASRRELEAQMQQAQKLESLGSLAGGLAHDMNNVLGAILGLASTLREKAGSSGPEPKALDTIIQACLRGRGVVKSMLYFARKDLQEERPLDLDDLVQEMAQLLGHTTLMRVQLQLDLAPDLPQVRGDGGALSHALMNLCVNAMDAMPEGGTLRISTARRADGGVELRVRDSGAGMPPEVLARCLEPFYTTKPRGKGTGLGLPMVQNTMLAHEGRLELQSLPGQGTEATLVFPASRVQAPAAAPEPEVAADQAGATGLDILLVDDDDLVRDSVTELLSLLGHHGIPARGGEEALGLLEGGLPADLVILDMNMPGMSGAQALPRILALRPGIPVLLATGYSQDDLTPILMGRPHVRALSKPFSARELQAQIDGFGIPSREARG